MGTVGKGLKLLQQCRQKLSFDQLRHLNLHEYQSKELLGKYGLNVQRFITVSAPDEVDSKLRQFRRPAEYVIKAQILAGGRGKGTFSSGLKGGVKLTKDPEEALSLAKKMLHHTLVTKQTGPKGAMVNKVMIAEALDIERETYVAILMDRETAGPVIVASPAGGMDIEQVAKERPHLIHKFPVDICNGLNLKEAADIAKALDFDEKLREQAAQQIMRLYELFLKVDATQVEINPLGETPDGQVVCFDAKINFDDSAEFRQQEIFAMDDPREGDPRERQADRANLNYIPLDGNIGCLVNGAGLAMATMDIIKLHGGQPANFLDVGGTVQENQVVEAFKIISSDSNVKAILVNIFGGIVNCETIASGLTNAFRKIRLNVPLVVRLEGTNVDQAKNILRDSNLPIITADDLDDAAKKAVAALS